MEILDASSAGTFLSICSLCDKAYTLESSYRRHVKYCQRAQSRRKGRPKSCTACNISKVKCSFEKPYCLRCKTKGICCIYGKTKTPIITTQMPLEGEASFLLLENSHQLNSNAQQVSDWTDDWQLGSLTQDLASPTLDLDHGQLVPFEAVTEESFDWNMPLFPSDAIIDAESWQPHLSSSESKVHPPLLTESSLQSVPKLTVTHLRQGSPASKHSIVLISNILGAFPHMMHRRKTFPPIIHGYWHRSFLPERLATCMSISQLFLGRNSETQSFLWRTLDAEDQRFRDELMTLSKTDIQSAIQANVIYIIMAIHERGGDNSDRSEKLIWTFKMLSWRLLDLLGGEYYSYTEKSKPSATWEDWVFAETRRRVTCLWFILSRVFSFQVGVSCTGNGRDLALVSNKRLWEARTREEWEEEKALDDASLPITTLGELLDARKNSRDPLSARRLANWEAGADTMAVMLNIATIYD